MFKLEIDTSNDAFKPSPHEELKSILKHLANEVGGWIDTTSTPLYDRNGNRVGAATLTEAEIGSKDKPSIRDLCDTAYHR